MDPGTAIAVAEIVCSVAKDLYSYSKDLEGYERDIKQFQEHLSWLYNVFKAVEDAVRHNNEISAQSKTLLQDALLRCRRDALKLSELVKRTKPVDVQPSAGVGTIRSKATKFLYPFRKPSMNELLEQIRACQNQLAFAVGLLQLEKTDLSQNRLEETYEKLGNVENIISSAEKEKRAERIIDTLAHASARSRRLAVEDAHAKTFKWIFLEYTARRSASPMPPGNRNSESITSNSGRTREHGTGLYPTPDAAREWSNDSRFARWLQGQGDVFWIRGKAGSGKSTLMKFIIDHHNTRTLLHIWAGKKKLVTAEHFFWLAGDQLQKSKYGMLQNLLHQLLKGAPDLVPKVCRMRWQLNEESARSWSTTELLRALQMIMESPEIRICLFIDGLDECDPENEHTALINELFNLASHTSVKIVASSRPWPAFDRCLTQLDTIVALEDLTRKDMFAYICDELTTHSRGQIPEDMTWSFGHQEPDDESNLIVSDEREAKRLVTNVLDKASGVFLWVSIVVNNLCEHLLARQPLSVLAEYVDRFPRRLEDYFRKNILERVRDTWISETAIALSIMTTNLTSFSWFWLMWVLSQKGTRFFDDPSAFLLPESSYPAASDVDVVISKVKAFLASCCKDLFSVVDPDKAGVHSASPTITFLHRTVLDFLETRETQLMISEHVPSHFSDATKHSGLALVAEKAFLASQRVVSHLAFAHLARHSYFALYRSHPILNIDEQHAILESLPLPLVNEYGVHILQAARLRIAKPSDVVQPVGNDWEAIDKRGIFTEGFESGALGLRRYIGWNSNHSDESLIQHLQNLADELQMGSSINAQALKQLVRLAKAMEDITYMSCMSTLLAALVQRGLSPVAIQLLQVLRQKKMMTKEPDTIETSGFASLLIVTLGSDIRGSISCRDVDSELLKTLLEIKSNPNHLSLPYFDATDGLPETDNENETVWQTFLRHLIFRHSGGIIYDQPHAPEAIRLLVEYGADLDANVHLTRHVLRDEAKSIVLVDPWKEKEGQHIPVLDILEAFLPAEDFEAIRK